MYVQKYSCLVVVNPDETIRVKQFADSTACKAEYRQALADGKDAYCYFKPIRQKTSVDNPLPVEVTL